MSGGEIVMCHTEQFDAIPEGTKILVDKKVLIEVLEDCWHLLVEVQRQKQRIYDKMMGYEQRETTETEKGGWFPVDSNLMGYGVPPEVANDLIMMNVGMGETARQACEKILFLRKAVLDKPPMII
ncbi:MAG: hypothetical protein WC824_07740 [Bacteroidota bacterium]|jgi:hypothetical protein